MQEANANMIIGCVEAEKSWVQFFPYNLSQMAVSFQDGGQTVMFKTTDYKDFVKRIYF